MKVLNRKTNPFMNVNVIHEFRARKGDWRGFPYLIFTALLPTKTETQNAKVITGISATLNKRLLKSQTLNGDDTEPLIQTLIIK